MKQSFDSCQKDCRRRLFPPAKGRFIAKAGITGYGEALLKEALHLDLGEVETIATIRPLPIFARTSIFSSTSAVRI